MGPLEFNRRHFLGGALAAAAVSTAPARSALTAGADQERLQLFWGDLHNHNAVGYAVGSLERSIEVAQEHLDFFAFTGHASWHDMPNMPGDRHLKWVRGFEAHSKHWEKTRRLIQDANSENFVALLGYEWHSSHFGDYCMIFPDDQPELYLPDHADKLLDFAEAQKAFAIPHHLGYKSGWRGANFDHFRASVTPVVEIFSEHGCCESDRAPFPMIRHSNGGRSTGNTVAPQLQQGRRFGFVASSDNHRGYPGAHGEGVLGVWARDLSQESLFDAIRSRRTYAATGDRIALEVALNEQPMGSETAAVADRQIDVRVDAQDSLQLVELIRNGKVIQRHFPEDHTEPGVQLPGKAKCRIHYGWGPWAALGLGRTCPWEMQIKITGGRFHHVSPCFQSGPYEEQMRDRLEVISDTEIRLRSFTSRIQCYGEDPTKALVLELEGAPDAVLTLTLKQPAQQVVQARLGDLAVENVVEFTGVFTSESLIINRLVSPGEYSAKIRWHDRRDPSQGADWYYVRATQHNGQMAWSSPIWVEGTT
ncbi:DUF3604 domain-containing protein [Lignipirellula cremea]|uniref:DUF3604 domain-containing protein n=1 Tax=Lignipirellula cremea TaxID=2528010 RepID=A0A518E109_9BACT|nr:DUF3604 domain-containing protein [Lignipirellula cremea]QDU97754.1 hypothetical protein Pla8534_56080 [Lignipirellula cremea]